MMPRQATPKPDPSEGSGQDEAEAKQCDHHRILHHETTLRVQIVRFKLTRQTTGAMAGGAIRWTGVLRTREFRGRNDTNRCCGASVCEEHSSPPRRLQLRWR